MSRVSHSDEEPIILSPTLLPSRLARLVSALSRSSTISLRLGTFVIETVLDSARIGTITSIDVSKRAVESLVFKAEEDVPEGGIFTTLGMSAINRTTTLAQLFASASFHFATSAVSTFSNLAQDSVHMVDSIFGSTESSRAIASIISLIRRELGDGSGLYGLVSGLTCFSILQARGSRRTLQGIEMRVLWDVVVLDTGETRTLEVKNTRADLYDELAVVKHIAPDAEVVVSTEEVTTKTTTIEVVGSSAEGAKVAIPDNAVVMEEEVLDPRDGENPRYRVMFQSISRRFNKKRGTGEDINAFSRPPLNGFTTSSMRQQTGSSIASQRSDSKVYEIEDPDERDLLEVSGDGTQRVSLELRPSVSSDVPSTYSLSRDGAVTPDGQLQPPADIRSHTDLVMTDDEDLLHNDGSPVKTSQYDDISVAPESPAAHEVSISRRISKSLKSVDQHVKRAASPFIGPGMVPISKKLSRHNSVPAVGATTITRRQSQRHLRGGKYRDGHHSSDVLIGSPSNSNSAAAPPQSSPVSGRGGRRRSSSTSFYTLKTTQSQTSLVLDASEEPQIQPFPPAHICSNLAKYMRFASASYGQSFMRLLGIGIADRMFPSTDAHHAEHHAFASHTGVGLDHILLSSFTDTAIDQSGGIPLVHFVAVDHVNKTVVLTIRGTLGLEDVLTDLTCEYQEFEWRGKIYKAHRGMLKSALLLKRPSSRVLMTIKVALEELGREYGLVICGHSLGGGVAALLSILISEPAPGGIFVTSGYSTLPAGRKIHSYAFGPPATISSDLRMKTRRLTTSVVYGLDIVPCLSLGVLRDFQSVALAFKADKQGVVDQIRKRVLSKLASRTGAFFDAQDDDYLWAELCKLRHGMQNEKLVPPGDVYHLTTSTVFETHDGRTKKATRVVGRVVLDVDKRFGEPVFGRGIFHHSPVYYERALEVLERGICEDKKDDGII
ncbi:hypothetical protein POJ06DRAFT_253118 [Lipomyces tetrasporus]|uniref:Fungal lipase-type domain-containing protein n=1 Tax=Lipomyces tetrasporus TaxID=54092 RepID=A0AAD7QSC8_9ASCO|nr:uncharacterized protein POJ06DRAFT_253118 [Lipomyces tetrasporus]KAJ8100573.1 hypothetical protein POJ06DRAFT_253118 [Lipomyces tetrasporus]